MRGDGRRQAAERGGQLVLGAPQSHRRHAPPSVDRRPPSTACRLPRLIFVTDAADVGERKGAERLIAACRGGVGLVQLRDAAAGAGELLRRAEALRGTVSQTLLMVNDRLDVAVAAAADGVQLGGRSLPAPSARRVLGPGALLGCSVHSVAEGLSAEAAGADFLIVGTIYATVTHPEADPAGPALLEAVAGAVRIPFFAIGGITAANAAECVRRGAHGVAVIRAIADAPDPEVAARELLAAVEA